MSKLATATLASEKNQEPEIDYLLKEWRQGRREI